MVHKQRSPLIFIASKSSFIQIPTNLYLYNIDSVSSTSVYFTFDWNQIPQMNFLFIIEIIKGNSIFLKPIEATYTEGFRKFCDAKCELRSSPFKCCFIRGECNRELEIGQQNLSLTWLRVRIIFVCIFAVTRDAWSDRLCKAIWCILVPLLRTNTLINQRWEDLILVRIYSQFSLSSRLVQFGQNL